MVDIMDAPSAHLDLPYNSQLNGETYYQHGFVKGLPKAQLCTQHAVSIQPRSDSGTEKTLSAAAGEDRRLCRHEETTLSAYQSSAPTICQRH